MNIIEQINATVAAVNMNVSSIVLLSPRKNASNESATPLASQRQATIAATMAMIESRAVSEPLEPCRRGRAVAAWGDPAGLPLAASIRPAIYLKEQDLNLASRLVVQDVSPLQRGDLPRGWVKARNVQRGGD